MQAYKEHKLSFRQAFKFIMVSCLIVCITLLGSFAFHQMRKSKRAYDERYKIVAIEQKCSSFSTLSTQTLAELLELSVDKPTNLYAFDTKAADAILTSQPFIKRAKIKAIKPGIIFVDYELRSPVALISDYQNIAIDYEKKLFPLRPIFLPKNLPEIYIGSSSDAHNLVQSKELTFAFEILQFFQNTIYPPSFTLKKIDVSKAFGKSANREIVIELDEQIKTDATFVTNHYFLRVMKRNYKESIGRFFTIKPAFTAGKLKAQANTNTVRIVDLRVPQLAFVKIEGN
jgi:hypothetical protein